MKIQKRPRFGKALFIFALVAVTAATWVYARRETLFDKPTDPSLLTPIVRTETLKADRTLSSRIVQNMQVDAVERVELLPRVTGRLLALHVKQGDRVKKGQVVATLEHEQQDALILSTIAQAASARADTEKARAEMLNAKTDLDRYSRLVKEGFSTQQQYDAIQTEYTSAEASYRAALAKERQYEAEEKRVKSEKNDYIIRAPIDGIVLNDYSLTAGAMISPSSPILDIADPRMLKATLRVPELKIFSVAVGMPVSLRFDALPGESFGGSVTRIDQYVDPATRTSSVEIVLDNEKQAGGRLRPGMFGQAAIVEKSFAGTLTVPEGALHASETGLYVYVVADGKAAQREVATGIQDGGRVQILGGLAEGDEVIIFGGNNLRDGEAVTVRN
ncbi:efflux RND transporter periplasmic adaptor subunit [uncultured Cloacibacillus sp.]|uniref:efflux RND transporter periplasmic adaptor subunit n=1 Tax=uncultured Cloacibacillus sp. TaxID=889794 RepID=UPI00260EC6A9|nr:efflux RND transporter periplasmic adaptor subunit [uncultured Cloacibacillus sp.]